MKPKISVIIPTYNRPHLLGQLLKSLSDQILDKSLFEIIVVENTPLKNAKRVVKKYTSLFPKERLSYSFEKNQGLHFARHAGAKLAKSEILAFLDDDALCNKDWLKNLLFVYENKKIGCAGGKIKIKWDKKPPSWILRYENVLGALNHGPKLRILKKNEYINGGNFSIRKKLLFEAGGFNPDQVKNIQVGDGETGLCKKLHKKGIKIAWMPKALVWHIQKVKPNATLTDMKRRFGSSAAVASYTSYKKEKFGRLELAKRVINFLSLFLKYRFFSFTGKLGKKKKWRHQTLLSAYYFKKALYELKLIHSRRFKKWVLKRSWL